MRKEKELKFRGEKNEGRKKVEGKPEKEGIRVGKIKEEEKEGEQGRRGRKMK